MSVETVARAPILVYQRHRERVEDAAVAAALALLVGIFLEGASEFPRQWQIVILIGIFGLGTQSRAWGYYAAIAAMSLPLWSLSPYLLTLFLAVTLLPRDWIIDGLPWALLVASAPLLAEWHLIGVVPLLAGLIATPSTALRYGMLAALWLKLAAGLSGWLPEIGALYGAPFTLDLLRSRVADANSLETLRLLVAPFTRSSFLLLLHVLQIVAWGLAGWLVAHLRELEWRGGLPRYPLVLALAPGVLLLWGAIYLAPAWLDLQPFATFIADPAPTVGLALSAMMATLLTTIYEGVQHPLGQREHQQPEIRMTREGAVGFSKHPFDTRRGRVESIAAEEDDVIMLELD